MALGRQTAQLEVPAILTALPVVLAAAGGVCIAIAVMFERRMQRHRQPGVSYREVTFRRDGGWRRADLFTPEGLRLQRSASKFGLLGTAFWVLALIAWVIVAVLAGPA